MNDLRWNPYTARRIARRVMKFAVPLAIVFLLVIPVLITGMGCKRETGVPGYESYVIRRPWGGKTTFVQTLRGVESTPLRARRSTFSTTWPRPWTCGPNATSRSSASR